MRALTAATPGTNAPHRGVVVALRKPCRWRRREALPWSCNGGCCRVEAGCLSVRRSCRGVNFVTQLTTGESLTDFEYSEARGGCSRPGEHGAVEALWVPDVNVPNPSVTLATHVSENDDTRVSFQVHDFSGNRHGVAEIIEIGASAGTPSWPKRLTSR